MTSWLKDNDKAKLDDVLKKIQWEKSEIQKVRDYLGKKILCIKDMTDGYNVFFKKEEFYEVQRICGLAHDNLITMENASVAPLTIEIFYTHFQLLTIHEYRKLKIKQLLNNV